MTIEKLICDACERPIVDEPAVELRHKDDIAALYYHGDCSKAMNALPIVNTDDWRVTTRNLEPKSN